MSITETESLPSGPAGTESVRTGSFSGAVRVRRQLFRAEDDGYAVLAVTDEDSDDEFTAVGPLGHLNGGDRAELSGEWQQHSRYGPQLRASGAKPLDPIDRDGQIAYLTSLRYIGPARAERLADEHGDGVLEAIATDPAGVFAALRGVSARQAEAATQSWHASRAVRDLHVRLAPHGFARADVIALAADVPRESDRRLQAAAAFALSEAERQGHTHLPLGVLRRSCAELLGLDPDPDVLASAPGLLVDEGRVYRKPTHACELWCAQTLRSRAAAPSHIQHDPGEEPPDGLTLEQWAAVRGAFASRLSVITGGPGVGKTVCTRAI